MLSLGFQQEELPVLGKVQDFEFTNSDSSTFYSKSLKNKVWLFNLFFTSCQGPCPLITANLKNIYSEYNSKSNFQMVSLSVDPQRDTPEKLTAYAKRFKVEPSKWYFIVGSEDKMREVAVNSFQLGTLEEPTMHSNRVVLVDAQSNIRGFYMGIVPSDIEKLKKDLKKLF